MSNQYIRRKFCDKCGSKTHEATVRGSFDKETGEPNTRDICTNQKCEDWCDFYNKHTFSIYGFGATCKNCRFDKNKVTTEDMMESTYMFFNSYRQKYGEQAATALITSFLKDVEILDTNEIKLSRGFGKGLGIELAYE